MTFRKVKQTRRCDTCGLEKRFSLKTSKIPKFMKKMENVTQSQRWEHLDRRNRNTGKPETGSFDETKNCVGKMVFVCTFR